MKKIVLAVSCLFLIGCTQNRYEVRMPTDNGFLIVDTDKGLYKACTFRECSRWVSWGK